MRTLQRYAFAASMFAVFLHTGTVDAVYAHRQADYRARQKVGLQTSNREPKEEPTAPMMFCATSICFGGMF
jgi:hypothetical protein